MCSASLMPDAQHRQLRTNFYTVLCIYLLIYFSVERNVLALKIYQCQLENKLKLSFLIIDSWPNYWEPNILSLINVPESLFVWFVADVAVQYCIEVLFVFLMIVFQRISTIHRKLRKLRILSSYRNQSLSGNNLYLLDPCLVLWCVQVSQYLCVHCSQHPVY